MEQLRRERHTELIPRICHQNFSSRMPGPNLLMLLGTRGVRSPTIRITPQVTMRREAQSHTDRELYDDLPVAGLYFTAETTPD
jgi:hypothetical protein